MAKASLGLNPIGLAGRLPHDRLGSVPGTQWWLLGSPGQQRTVCVEGGGKEMP